MSKAEIISRERAAAELLARRRARNSMAGFCEYVLRVVPALHHQMICHFLERLIHGDEWDELIILAPPGSAKSTYTSWALPSYAIGTSPTPINILICSYAAELAERWGRKIRNTVGGVEFQSLFPSVELSKDSAASGRWATERGDELYAAGVGSGILGFRADLATIDDPISGFEEAQSLTQLEKVHSWYETDFVTRLKPLAKVVLICQRLARNDLAGYMIDRNLMKETRRQCVLSLPMVAGVQDPLGNWVSSYENEKGEMVIAPVDPLQRKPGERLWPDWFTEQQVIDAQRDDFKWKTLYQQKPPSDDGSWISTEDIRFRSSPGPDAIAQARIYGTIDLALSVSTGDQTAIFIAAVHDNGTIDIIDGEFCRRDSAEIADDVCAWHNTYRPIEWLIDDDNSSKVFYRLLQPLPWKPMPIRGQNKEIRASALRGMFKRGLIYLPEDKKSLPWVAQLVAQLLKFPNAIGEGVDDGVDSIGLLGRRLHAVIKPVLEIVKPLPIPTIQNMTLEGLWEEDVVVANRRI